MRILRKPVLALLCIAQINAIKAQELKSLFQSGSVLKITIKFSLQEVITDLDERNYHEAKLSYYKPDGLQFNHKVKVKVRGNNRAKPTTCKFPPLKINFKKDKTENSIFEGQNKIKLVTHCNKNKIAEQLILKEYLAYKLYQEITPYSFNVRLCEITYIDISNNNEASTHYGFFIEDIDGLAARNNMYVYKKTIPTQESCRREELDKLTVFQFMIGNLDWSIPNRHNMKLISDSETNLPIPVPYDFDYAGFVGAPYAIPPENFDVANVKIRYFMGMCRVSGGYNSTLLFYRNHKAEILSVVKNPPYLSEKNKGSSLKYLEGFFDILDKPNQVNQKIIKGCRVDHKHVYQYDN